MAAKKKSAKKKSAPTKKTAAKKTALKKSPAAKKKTAKPTSSVKSAASGSKADRFVIIMAGGRGERFWPVSREATPKQLIRILGKKSFLQEAVERCLPLVPLKNIIIITNKVQAPEVCRQLPKLPKENVVAEPIGRDTCAAVTLGAAIVGARSTTATMAVLPADHVIPDEAKFQKVLEDSFDLASRGQALVTIGIKPNEPATGYGYIKFGKLLPKPKGGKKYRTKFYVADQFKEKPNYDTALEYVNSGQYRWNAGMFIWSFVAIAEALQKHQPEMDAACHRWFAAATKGRLDRVLKKEYPAIKKISIDFALMEKAQNVIVADGSFKWDDLGAWNALARHVKNDREGNAAMAEFIHVDAARNIIFDGRTKNRTPIAVVGVTDCILVQTDDAVLLAHKSQSDKIKLMVKKLAEHPKFKKLV
jgi:mannose-1-phosphate guanylyltransferase